MREPIFASDPQFDAMSLDELRAKRASGERARALGALARRSASDASILPEVFAALRNPSNRTTKIMNVPIAHIGIACLWIANESTRDQLSDLVREMADPERAQLLAFLRDNEIALDVGVSTVVTRYSEGNSDAPFGSGQWTVEVRSDETIRVIHEKRGKRAEWRACALPPLVPAIAAALAKASFPARPSVREAPPGTLSFSLMASAPDGDLGVVSGFVSPEYSPLGDLFAQVVNQVAGDRVFGSTMPIETQYVSDAREVA